MWRLDTFGYVGEPSYGATYCGHYIWLGYLDKKLGRNAAQPKVQQERRELNRYICTIFEGHADRQVG